MNQRLFTPVGLTLAVLPLAGYLTWTGTGHLASARHLPLLAVPGATLALMGFLRRRNLVRGLALVLALAGAVLTLVFAFGLRLRPYEGPMRIGERPPAFAARDASGASFDSSTVADGQSRLLVFYRGWW
ncbi:MAG: hypothetical protein R3F20_12875 [Planctomycetota bacterium]